MSVRGATPDGGTKATCAPKPGRGRAAGPTRRRRAALTVAEASAGMLVRELSVRAPDVVFVKSIIEASEGVAAIFAERGGELTIAAPQGRGAELAELLQDIASEVGGELEPARAPDAPAQATDEPPANAGGVE
jgi:hypothetical protein